MVIQPVPAGATTDTVTTCSGSAGTPGSLAYEVASAGSGDTITFSVTCPISSPIVLSSPVDIAQDITLSGPGASKLAISGNNAVEVFNIASGASIVISGITIEKGSTTDGGGILNSGTLSLTNVTLTNNNASVAGGGIYNDGSLNVDGSTFSGNTGAEGGGGIINANEATAVITNSSLTNNTGGSDGGGIVNDGRLNDESPGILTVTDTTVSDNTSTCYGGGIASGGPLSLKGSTLSGNGASCRGGGIETFGGTMTVSNSTIADNTSTYGGGIDNDGDTASTLSNTTLSGNQGDYGSDLYSFAGTMSVSATILANGISAVDCGGSLLDGGYNLDDDSSCGFTASTDFPETPSGLAPSGLQNNGGPTETLALQSGSAAIGAVNVASLCLTPDQRGIERPTPCDIGAFETDTTAESQAITFNSSAPSHATYDGTPYLVSASGGGSGNAVILTVDASTSSVCSISQSTVTFTGVGTCTIDADQAGNTSYSAAPEVKQTFNVDPESQNIVFTSMAPDATVDGPIYNVTANGGGSDNGVVFSIDATTSSICQIYQTNVSFQSVGTCTIDANQAGNTDYSSASTVQQSFMVGPEAQAITSANSWNVMRGRRVGFEVTTTGMPVPTITESGKLPRHIKFKDNRDGSATMMGSAKVLGTYNLKIKATFGKGKTKRVVTQAFTIIVGPE